MRYTDKQLKRLIKLEKKEVRHFDFQRTCSTYGFSEDDFEKTFNGNKTKNSNVKLFNYRLKQRVVFEREVKRVEKKPPLWKRTVYNINFSITVGTEITLNTHIIKRIGDSEYICNGVIMEKNKIIKLLNE
ncbi:MAG: hypothetical protein ACRCZ9_11325 [Fusobacteriaceae bacterium]